MTPEEQRIAIAEACGWERDELCDNWKLKGGEPWDTAFLNNSCNHRQLPDYLNDLNAMAQAEKVGILHSNELTLEYFNQLSKFAGPNARSIQDSAKIFCATAAQRAEAFLRTIGQWKDY